MSVLDDIILQYMFISERQNNFRNPILPTTICYKTHINCKSTLADTLFATLSRPIQSANKGGGHSPFAREQSSACLVGNRAQILQDVPPIHYQAAVLVATQLQTYIW